jgi:hypothetical protein
MSNEIIDGDAELGDDGVLQGWCWNARKPNERQVVEVLIDERIVSTSVASRFREDLRTRKIGDGYYGFMTTLSRTLAEAGVRFVVTARERGSGRCFWRHIRGRHALPGNFPERMDALRERLSGIARSPAFSGLGDTSLAAGLAAELGGLGARLNETRTGTGNSSPLRRARRQLLRRIAPATIEALPDPRAALVLVADSASDEALSAVAALAPQIRELRVSLTLVDRGASSETALAPSLFGNLHYVFDPNCDVRSLLTRTLSRSTADFLIFVRNPPATLGEGLAEVLPQMLDGGSLHLRSRCVSHAYRVLGHALPPGIRRRTASTPIGLEFAGRRRVLERFIGLPTPQGAIASLEAVDLAIRAARGDLDPCIWDEPDRKERPAWSSQSTYAVGNDAA